MNRQKIKTTGVRRQSASRIKKRARTHTHIHTHHAHEASDQSLTDTACFPKTQNVQCIRPNIPINKKTKTHTAAFYPKGSVTTKSPHSGPHSCCYGRKAELGEEGRRRRGGGGGGGGRKRKDDMYRGMKKEKAVGVENKKGGGQVREKGKE